VTTLGLARWYVDADTLGLAHVLIRARPDVTFPGDDGTRHTARWTLPPCPVQQTATRDTEWIPKVAAANMAIISRDRAISRRRAEKDAILAAGAQMFAITDSGQLRVWDLLEIIMHRWRDREQMRERPGPYIFALTRTRMTEIDLL
jgi:PIN like domain